jgi:RNA recognition motif. (a.k.a. RRM, RBD, or RNP domain)
VLQSLDKSNLGNTRISIRAIFSQSGSLEEREDFHRGDEDYRQLNACSLCSPVTDDLNIGYLQPAKWFSEDPNILGGVISELREELGVPGRPDAKKSKHHTPLSSKLKGDAAFIDGPEEYAYQHYQPQQYPRQASHPQAGQPYSGFYYPYNAMYYNYHPPNAHLDDSYSLHGAYQPYGHRHHGGNWSDNHSWYSYEPHPPHSGAFYGPQQPFSRPPPSAYHSPTYPEQPKRLDGQLTAKPHALLSPVPKASQNSDSKESQDDQKSSSSDGQEDHSTSGKNQGDKNSSHKNRNQLKRFKQIIEAKASHILHVKGLESEEITAELLNSLFSNFGNIVKILFVKHKKAAFIVYENQDLATIAKEMLSNLRFCDCHLKVASAHQITFCNETTFEKILAKEAQNQLLIPNPKFYRFKDKKISINPPSKTLHLSNVAREIYTEDEIARIFEEVCPVKRVK